MIRPGSAFWPRVKLIRPTAFCQASSTTCRTAPGGAAAGPPQRRGAGPAASRQPDRTAARQPRSGLPARSRARTSLVRSRPVKKMPIMFSKKISPEVRSGKERVLGRIEAVQIAIEAQRRDAPGHGEIRPGAVVRLLRQGKSGVTRRSACLAVGQGSNRQSLVLRCSSPRASQFELRRGSVMPAKAKRGQRILLLSLKKLGDHWEYPSAV